jgi:ABC-type xylose transport system permease subunit
VLIYEAEGHSEVYRKGKDMIDARIYGGIGSFLGVCVAAFLQNTFLSLLFLDSRLVFATGMIVGGVVGAVVGWWNWRYR